MKWLLILWLLSTGSFATDYLKEAFDVTTCNGPTGAPNEPCFWYYKVKKTTPAKKLVIFFSGGEMRCDENFNGLPGNRQFIRGYDLALSRYADDGYIAVCAGLFKSSQGAWIELGAIISPYVHYSQRMDVLVKAITDTLFKRGLWDGENLLLSGVSHGATAPVIAMARTSVDWKGSSKTAACFFDGIYSAVEQDRYWWQNQQTCGDLRDQGICKRYLSTSSCEYPIPITGDVADDTLSDVTGGNFKIKDWKLIECGSALARACPPLLTGDVVPKEPIEALCTALQNNGASCVLDPLPYLSHATCASDNQGVDKCRLWFNSKISK